jgi:hypothetical protein
MKVQHLTSEVAHTQLRHGKVSDRTEAEVDLCVCLSKPLSLQGNNIANPPDGSLTHPSNATKFGAIRPPRWWSRLTTVHPFALAVAYSVDVTWVFNSGS